MALLPLGLISQGGGAGGAGAFELISTAYGTGSSGTITFSSIPATYTHLQIRATTRNDYGSTSLNTVINFNSDSGSNYSYHELYTVGSTVYSEGQANQSSMNIISSPSASSTSSVYSGSILDILDYKNTNKYKTLRLLTGYAAGSPYELGIMSGSWRNTAAITSISISTVAGLGNFTTASRFSLYGIKG